MSSAQARQDSGWDTLEPDERNSREQQGMAAWGAWMDKHAAVVLDSGGPLGRTKQITTHGVADMQNSLVGYVVIQAASHEEAAGLFADHPHFCIFPGEGVEVMECLPVPGQ